MLFWSKISECSIAGIGSQLRNPAQGGPIKHKTKIMHWKYTTSGQLQFFLRSLNPKARHRTRIDLRYLSHKKTRLIKTGFFCAYARRLALGISGQSVS